MGSRACTKFFNFSAAYYRMASKNVQDMLNQRQVVEEENIGVVRQFFEAAGTGDTSKAHEFIDPDWVSSDAKANPKLKTAWARTNDRGYQDIA